MLGWVSVLIPQGYLLIFILSKQRDQMIDTSRQYLKPCIINNILFAMSLNKLNVLHWHITDTQSFPFVSKVYPLFASKGAFGPYQQYSLNDIADLVSYAQERGIRVVPEFDVCYIIYFHTAHFIQFENI